MMNIDLQTIISFSDTPETVTIRVNRAQPAAFIRKSPVAKLVLAKVLDE